MKLQLARMTADEQSELESFLKASRVAARGDFRQRIAAAQDRMDRGEGVTATELRALLQATPPRRE